MELSDMDIIVEDVKQTLMCMHGCSLEQAETYVNNQKDFIIETTEELYTTVARLVLLKEKLKECSG